MAAVPAVRALLSLHRSVTVQHSFGLIKVQLRSTCLPRSLSSAPTKSDELKQPVNLENESLLQNLNLMGVDVKMARQRQPGVLRKTITNEEGLAQFLQSKGAGKSVIASIISRYPRAITRSVDHLEQRWELWRNIFKTDSFFRSSDNENLKKNIAFVTSLGLTTKDLHRLLTTAPRTFSNSLALNRQMVELLQDVCAELGGKNPEEFAKTRVRANIDNLRASLNLNDSELLALLQGPGAEILDLSNEYLKKNFISLQQRMVSLGCWKADIKKLINTYPMVLYIGTNTLSAKLDCLLKGGITMRQILEKPKVLDFSTQNITERLVELQRVGYDFQKNGINILDSSRKRFDAKIKKLAALDVLNV
uniref:Mitochondrial transcription termination factor 1 n=1 Tax=Lates calcarifer TaxID=8187 RepID=A0A4W6CBD1_LATCA